MPGFPRYAFLYPTTGTTFTLNLDSPGAWCRANPTHAALEPARVLLTCPEPDGDDEQLLAAVLRRTKLALVRWLWPTRVVVSYWSHAQRPNLFPWVKEHRLGRAEVSISLVCLKHDSITATTGEGFLQGDRLPADFPLAEYRSRFAAARSNEPWPGVAPALVSYCWPGQPDGYIPWETLRCAWQGDSATCPNCDVPVCLYRFDFVRSGFLNWSGREDRLCFSCRRRFHTSFSGHTAALRALPPELRPTEWTGFGWQPRVRLDHPGATGRPRDWDTAEELVRARGVP